VSLKIYNVEGALVVTLMDELRVAGTHVARWDGRTSVGAIAPSGVYFARLEAGGVAETRKVALLK
jgi:flagellar hook assembly protein FlgD